MKKSAMRKAKKTHLSVLANLIEQYAGKPFVFRIVNCEYKIDSGVFNQVDFYKKVSKIKPEHFIEVTVCK